MTNTDTPMRTPPSAAVLSNRVVLANGGVGLVDSVTRATSGNTNIYLVSFEGRDWWILLPGDLPGEFAVGWPNTGKPQGSPTLFVVGRKPGAGTPMNAPSPKRRRPAGRAGILAKRMP